MPWWMKPTSSALQHGRVLAVVALLAVGSAWGRQLPTIAAASGGARPLEFPRSAATLLTALDEPLKLGQFPPMFLMSSEALKTPELLFKGMDGQGEGQLEMRILGRYGSGTYDVSASLCALLLANPSDRRTLEAAQRYFNLLLQSPRAYYDPGHPEHPFDYGSPQANQVVGKDGYFFNIYGPWEIKDPLTGATSTWRQWQTKTGENAWVMKFLLYLNQYILSYFPEDRAMADRALVMATQLGDAALCLQIPDGELVGAYRMGPRVQANTYYDQVSIENVESMESSLRYLYLLTGDYKYTASADAARDFLDAKAIVFQDNDRNLPLILQEYILQNGRWMPQGADASDVVAWYLLSSFHRYDDLSGLERIDQRYGEGFVIKLVKNCVRNFGVFENGRLTGMSYSQESARMCIKSCEWGRFWEIALKVMAKYTAEKNPADAAAFKTHALGVAKGLDALRDADGFSPYSSSDDPREMTSSKWGWNIMPRRFPSLVSTAWDILASRYSQSHKTPFQPLLDVNVIPAPRAKGDH